MTVIGVAVAEFRGIDVGQVPSLWIPAAMSSQAIPGFYSLLEAHALDANARPSKAGRYADTSSDRVAAMVQGDVGRRHTPRRISQNNY